MRRFQFLISLLIIVGLLSGCGGDDGKNKNNSSGGATPPTNKAPADLAVSNIELDPAQIAVGQTFTVKVYVTNGGTAPSGEYDLEINLRDETRGVTSPIGAQHGQSIQPGQDVLAYETGPRKIDQSGSYQVQVTLIPVGPDGDANNNKQNRAFTIQ